MNAELKEVKNWHCSDKIPTITDYKKLLDIASERFNLSINECRDKFGKYTYSEWKKLLTQTKMQTLNTAPQLQYHLENNILEPLKPDVIQNIIQVVNQFNNGEINLQDEIFDGAGVSVGQMFEDLKIEVIENEQEII